MKVMPDPVPESLRLPVSLDDLSTHPLVSVLVVNYNYADYLDWAIRSVLRQSYENFELVVCDDGSTDNSREVVAHYAASDGRVKAVLKENGGVASALNAAFVASCGQIICLLDSDDAFAVGKLAEVVHQFQACPDTGFLVHPMMIVDQGGEEVSRIPFMTRFERGWIAEKVIRRGGRWRFMPASALCLRRDVAAHVFPIPEEFRSLADLFIYTLAPLLTPVGAAEQTLAYYRIHGANLTASVNDSAAAACHLEAYRRIIGAVNARLEALGLGRYALEVERNLDYETRAFLYALTAGEPRRRLWPQYAAFIRRLCGDDLYRVWQKVIGVGVYAVAVMLPLSKRAGFIRTMLGEGRVKRHLQNVGSRIKSIWAEAR